MAGAGTMQELTLFNPAEGLAIVNSRKS